MENREPSKFAQVAAKVCSVGAGLAAQAAVIAVAAAAETWKPIKVLMVFGSVAANFAVQDAVEEPTTRVFDRIAYASKKIGDAVAKAVKAKQEAKAVD